MERGISVLGLSHEDGVFELDSDQIILENELFFYVQGLEISP